ncbi:MAG: hypothetical protein A3D67_02440 [Candidatus Lloydbacteria bacterium RIFCSPHIGHO2_02_FULL_51_22]|uniref:Uncharacterized protein n=3 Tax=Candidatus Lloydiibacteriota TaxID=1817910 RepID=A0A1G2DER4_9BACT|nr:MAG: hypothetical protein A3D67_02440 [Candidatus Lloydbacteria bacterium RIFCSPHIGHO2_02_FULL_51_22]OGZ14804.1 MAG: hypothetical protein A3J08_00495 [Candidatus Lloydbacteria bacterium RIFCSPLOWO2_02_FULL_51_11]OGZ15896.1 MAG: hypothetical protein A3G11_02250 [Candidatus Lloydbacteria bacterium RIFCSPLOWO2_12_FULL_51_9]
MKAKGKPTPQSFQGQVVAALARFKQRRAEGNPQLLKILDEMCAGKSPRQALPVGFSTREEEISL